MMTVITILILSANAEPDGEDAPPGRSCFIKAEEILRSIENPILNTSLQRKAGKLSHTSFR